MNNTNSTEELLKTVDLTLDEVYGIIKEGVKNRCGAFALIRELSTPEDLTQDVLVYYLSTMKSTGDVRLNYYIKKYKTRAHIVNLIKQTSYQFPLHLTQSTLGLHRTVSLDKEILLPDAYETTTMENFIADPKAEKAIYSNVTDKELMDMLKEELTRLNMELLEQKHDRTNKERYNEYNLPFLLDTNNYIKAYNKTLTQLQMVKDLSDGYSKKSLGQKYKDYTEDMVIIKKAFLGKLHTYIRTSY